MIQKVVIEEFLKLAQQYPMLDVRSPGEYHHAHIPGAHPLPLFSDEERKIVGTAYKQEGREVAIKLGLDYFGLKMRSMVEEVEKIAASSKSKTVLVHCWRGGMRSAGVAWLLDLYGFKVHTLVGGYKAFRNWALQQFEQPYSIHIIGGYTGSGKTKVLQELKRSGQSIIDLEAIANHKGSAFGDQDTPQPTQEMFENLLACELHKIQSQQPEEIWVEDESQRIGLVNIPNALWKNMQNAPCCFMKIPFEERLDHIVIEYGKLKKEKLVNAIIRIQKRLGGNNTKMAVNFLLEDNIKEAFRILLTYYDKYYEKSIQSRKSVVISMDCENTLASANMKKIIATRETAK